MTPTPQSRRVAAPAALVEPVVDVVIPVKDEEGVLVRSVERLHAHLTASMPWSWRITVADSASVDGTWACAQDLAGRLDGVRAVHVAAAGRGRALRSAWTGTDAEVLVYMDVDLSTGLTALVPLVSSIVSGHADVAIGSRLGPGALVARGPKRELISRAYNVLLGAVFAVRFKDAQCGFKAIRADLAQVLLPAVEDEHWFFDTELLLLAERNGLRVVELPVDWVDDLDSRVRVARTAVDDLKGVVRMAGRFAGNDARVDLGDLGRAAPEDDFGRSLLKFGVIGVVSTGVSAGLYVGQRLGGVGPIRANALAVSATFVGNTWAHRRWMAMGQTRGVPWAGATAVFVTSMGVTSAALVAVARDRDTLGRELVVLAGTWSAAAVVRFLHVRTWVQPALGP